MNWKETLNIIKPLVLQRGYLMARAFLLNRKTHKTGVWFLNKLKKTKFIIKGSLYNNGVVLKLKHNIMNFINIY